MECLSGGKFLGWFKFEDVYNFSNNIASAVYSFAICKKVPENNLLPFNIKEVFYIGESGGQDPTWDQKDKKTGRGYLQSSFHKRMKQHARELIKEVKENIDSDEIVVVGVFVPKNIESEVLAKQWQKSVESELIHYFALMHGESPKYNLAHQSETSRKKTKPDSISQKKVQEAKTTDLSKFYE
jgi:hypothetical protein